MDALEDLPPWFIPAVLVLIVIVAMIQGRSSGAAATNGNGSMINYTPVPLDQGAVQIATAETAARAEVFSNALSYLGATEISRLSAGRDIALETLHADSANRMTQAALDADLAHTQATEAVAMANDATTRQTTLASIAANLQGLTNTNATQLSIARTDAARDTSVAETNANRDITLANVNSKTAITTNAQTTNTQKAESHNSVIGSIVGTVGKAIGGIAHFFGF